MTFTKYCECLKITFHHALVYCKGGCCRGNKRNLPMNIFWYIDIGISVYQICMHNKRPSRYTWLWVGGWSQRGREWGWCALALAALAERWPVKCSRNTSPTQPFRYQPPMGQSLIYAGIGGGAGLRGISNFSVGHSSADGHPLTHFCGEWCSVCTLTEWMDRTEARLLVPVPPPRTCEGGWGVHRWEPRLHLIPSHHGDL